jgi:hypothetical protein
MQRYFSGLKLLIRVGIANPPSPESTHKPPRPARSQTQMLQEGSSRWPIRRSYVNYRTVTENLRNNLENRFQGTRRTTRTRKCGSDSSSLLPFHPQNRSALNELLHIRKLYVFVCLTAVRLKTGVNCMILLGIDVLSNGLKNRSFLVRFWCVFARFLSNLTAVRLRSMAVEPTFRLPEAPA